MLKLRHCNILKSRRTLHNLPSVCKWRTEQVLGVIAKTKFTKSYKQEIEESHDCQCDMAYKKDVAWTT